MFLPCMTVSCVFGKMSRSSTKHYVTESTFFQPVYRSYGVPRCYLFSADGWHSAAFSDHSTASTHYYGDQ